MPREKKGQSKVASKPIAGARPVKSAAAVKLPVKKKITSADTARQLAARSRKRASAKPVQPAKHAAHPGISITLQIPALRRAKDQSNPTERNRFLHGRYVVPAIVIAVILGAVGGYLGIHLRHHKIISPAVAQAAIPTEPDYQPLVPSDGETTARNFDGKKNLVSYDTTFSDARVTVSQQLLPANFATDTNALQRAADSINAKQKITTGQGPVYVASSDTDKSQMGLLAAKSVLIFIHTDKTLDDTSWKSFVELLTQKNWQDFDAGAKS